MLPPFKEGAQVAPCAQCVTSFLFVRSLFEGCSARTAPAQFVRAVNGTDDRGEIAQIEYLVRSVRVKAYQFGGGFVDYQHRHTGGKMVSQAAPTFQPMGKAVDAIRLARGAVKRAFDLCHALFFLPGIQAHKSRIHADFGMVVLACADFLC